MPIRIQKEVFRLQITINDVETVQVIERQRDLGCIKFGDGIRESL